MVTLCKLVAQETDSFGYTTYVFENLEEKMIRQSKYIMCVRYVNWEHKEIKLGEIGYLKFKEIIAGTDKWFDGTNMIPYKYDDVQFIKFVEKPKKEDHKYIM